MLTVFCCEMVVLDGELRFVQFDKGAILDMKPFIPLNYLNSENFDFVHFDLKYFTFFFTYLKANNPTLAEISAEG